MGGLTSIKGAKEEKKSSLKTKENLMVKQEDHVRGYCFWANGHQRLWKCT